MPYLQGITFSSAVQAQSMTFNDAFSEKKKSLAKTDMKFIQRFRK
jgi:hypothetical protein